MVVNNWNNSETLRLQVDAALSVVPLISTLVASLDDRKTIITDVVNCWLALPKDIRDQYCGPGLPDNRGLPRFGGDYVETVELGSETELEVIDPGPADLAEEQRVFRRWMRHLERVKAREAAGGFPDERWLESFPPQMDGEITDLGVILADISI